MDLGNLGNLGPDQLQQYIGNVDFPAQKEEVASNAESNGAPGDLVQKIRNAATERFDGPQDVLKAVQGS